MLPALEAFFLLAEKIPAIEYVNIGGGVGINYASEIEEFDLPAYGQKICEMVLMLRKKTRRSIRLIFEPGRRLAAPSGAFVTTITDIKYLNGIRYIVVDASVAIFPRPLHHPDSFHEVISPFKTSGSAYGDSVVVGKTTFSKDIMTRQKLPVNLEIGDTLLFDQAGAYCDSMRSKFLGQHEPSSIFINA